MKTKPQRMEEKIDREMITNHDCVKAKCGILCKLGVLKVKMGILPDAFKRSI